MIFETARMIVRHFTAEDAEAFYRLNGDEEVVRFIRPAKSREETDAFLKEVIEYSQQFPRFGRMAILSKETNEIIGSFALIPVKDRERMQLGYAFLPEAWGKGFATEVSVAGVEYAILKAGVSPLYAYAEKLNVASDKVLLKSGFKQVETYVEDGKEMIVYIIERSA